MKNLIFGLIATVFFTSLTFGQEEVTDIAKFAKNHVKLNNEILTILISEKNLNFDNFPFTELTNSQNVLAFYQALERSGMIKHKELGDLILKQVQGADSFLRDNSNFSSLNEEAKRLLITNEISKAIDENPISWPDGFTGNIALGRTCYEQYVVDRNRCNRDCNIQGAFAIAAFAGGPVAGGIACLLVSIQTNNCLKDARSDYNDCIND